MKNIAFPHLRLLAMAILLAHPICAEANSKLKLSDIPEKNPKEKPKSSPFLPEEPPQKHKAEKDEPTSITMEENYGLIRAVTEDFYQKGLTAMKQGDLSTAETYFDRVLAIKPNHKGAQLGMEAIMNAYEDATPTTSETNTKNELVKKLEEKLNATFLEENYEDAVSISNEILAIDPTNTFAKQKWTISNRKLTTHAIERAQAREDAGDEQGAIDAYQLAVVYGKDPSLKTRIAALREKIAEKNKLKSNDLYIQALYATQNGNFDEAISLCKQALSFDPKNIQAQRMLERLLPQPSTTTP